jgi:hypothetical protein
MQSGVVTLTGSAQNLATALGFGTTDPRAGYVVGWLSLQADTANSDPIYVGTDTSVATTYGQRIEAPASTIPPAPTIVEDAKYLGMHLNDFYVVGTNNEKLRVMWLNG